MPCAGRDAVFSVYTYALWITGGCVLFCRGSAPEYVPEYGIKRNGEIFACDPGCRIVRKNGESAPPWAVPERVTPLPYALTFSLAGGSAVCCGGRVLTGKEYAEGMYAAAEEERRRYGGSLPYPLKLADGKVLSQKYTVFSCTLTADAVLRGDGGKSFAVQGHTEDGLLFGLQFASSAAAPGKDGTYTVPAPGGTAEYYCVYTGQENVCGKTVHTAQIYAYSGEWKEEVPDGGVFLAAFPGGNLYLSGADGAPEAHCTVPEDGTFVLSVPHYGTADSVTEIRAGRNVFSPYAPYCGEVLSRGVQLFSQENGKLTFTVR